MRNWISIDGIHLTQYGLHMAKLPLWPSAAETVENTVIPGQKSDCSLALENASQIEVVPAKEMPSRWGWRIEDAPTVLKAPAVLDGRDTTVTLVPYNCTKFRVSMFPEK